MLFPLLNCFLKNQFGILYGLISGFSILFRMVMSGSSLVPHSSDYSGYILVLEIGWIDFSQIFILLGFFRIVLSILVPLPIHINLRITCLYLEKKKLARILIGIMFKLFISVGKSCQLSLCWIFHSRNSMSFYILRSFLINFFAVSAVRFMFCLMCT